ncbi:MAG TPA: ABC transporter ATP-binding protein [Bacteroidetes bacterium]|nr:ABC transporter ATP-binding protein [Bacteroidota bacterium]
MDNITIKIQGLSTGFSRSKGKEKILHRGLNLNVGQGELICIVGPNGSGKSTLLKTLLGFIKPLEGEVFFENRLLNEMTVKELSRMVSVVLTEKIEDTYLTAYEIVLTGRYPHGSFLGKLTEEDELLIDRAFRQVGIRQLAHRSFFTLSDGEKQRAMIARTIVQQTPFIFLDEPVAYIDAPGRIGIMQLLKKLTKDMCKGILMATHDIDSVLHYADRLWLLGMNGKWKEGKAGELVEAGFINDYFDLEDVKFNTKNHRFEWKGR